VAVDVLGPERLATVLPFLQPSIMSGEQRRQLRERDLELGELRQRVAGAAGIEPPQLQQVRRITWGTIVRVVLPAVAVVALISALSGLGIDQVVDELASASWGFIAAGFVIAQLPRVSQAVSTMGASPVPLPLGPTYALQLAISYVNLAIPTSAARVAVNIRFFQLHGVAPGGALAAGALDGFSGFVVQACLLLGLLLLTPMSLDLDLSGATSDGIGRVVLLVVLLAIVAIAVVAIVPSLRRRVVTLVRGVAGDALKAIRDMQSPRRLGMLFGGNVITELLFATALLTFARAFGADIGFGEALAINISTALLSGLMPIPGGIGVTEGALIYGLVRAGVPDEAALAATITYRLAAFYLPPVWGFFAMRWMERNHHL
jgi:uncharacterized membrane protein YbhN (UPF0104 family)